MNNDEKLEHCSNFAIKADILITQLATKVAALEAAQRVSEILAAEERGARNSKTRWNAAGVSIAVSATAYLLVAIAKRYWNLP